MTVRLATGVRNSRVDVVNAALNAGAGSATIKIYTGSQPASPATAPSGSLLVTMTCNDPAFGSPASGIATMDVTPDVTGVAVADGDAGWARFADSDGTVVMDCTVGEAGADLTINEATIVTGQDVTVDAGNPLTLTDPA